MWARDGRYSRRSLSVGAFLAVLTVAVIVYLIFLYAIQG
jgi:hypothetical protein